MIYKIVEIRTGRRVADTEVPDVIDLRQLKNMLAFANTGTWLRSNSIAYAIACHLPSECFIQVGKWVAPTKIEDLSDIQRQRFWSWYAQQGNNSYTIPATLLCGTPKK